ncbi:MAG TPA: DUF692 family protein [Myxococcales bacterium]|nr:DUF692 family protein [Myxococcales bacterium]
MSGGARWTGLGLSTNLAVGGAPDPFAILQDAPDAFDYVEYSAPLDVDQARREAPAFAALEAGRARGTPALFHPVHLNLYGPELEAAESLRALDAHARAVGSPWVGNDVAWWHSGGVPFPGHLYVPPPLSEEGLADCTLHARHVQAALSMPLLLENPAVIARRGTMHVLELMARLHEATGCGLILDLGHLLSFQLSAGLPPGASLGGFPLEAVREIHVAGGAVTRVAHRELYLDDHSLPVREEVFGLLRQVLPGCTALEAVTFEGDGHPDAAAKVTLRSLRDLVPRERRAPEPPPPPRRAAGPGPRDGRLRTDPWAILREVLAGEGPDPLGARVELEYRLAVLAEELDRAWPMSRPLLLPDRAALAAFSRSEELWDAFHGAPGGVPGAFARHARRQLHRRPDEGAAAAHAFELWAHSALDRADPPGGRRGSFPVDLSELWHAVRAVRRHALGRAMVSGSLDGSEREVLAQVARRARPGPWEVALRREGGRLFVQSLAPRGGIRPGPPRAR